MRVLHIMVIGLAVALVVCTGVAPAVAGWGWDRDAGAKARGEYGPVRDTEKCLPYRYRDVPVVRQCPKPSEPSKATAPQTTRQENGKAIVAKTVTTNGR